jgi:hypothetical protein
MNYKKINNLVGWAVFAIALIVYTLTMERNGSLWDCGEFAGTSDKLGVPHPPGAPLFILITRIFAFVGNAIGVGADTGMAFGAGALSSALTILFLFWTITHFAKKISIKSNNQDLNGDSLNVDGTGANFSLNSGATFGIMAAGVIGALAFTFSDSFWYSAVETEVYAMSSLCTAVVFWAALKWEDHPENTLTGSVDGRNRADKWMILVFFIMGMSIGIHLLNILTIPPIILIYYFKRYNKTSKGTWIAFASSIVILGFVQKAVGQWSVAMAFPFDRFFVNSLGLPPITGFVFFFILVGVAFFYLIRYANRNGYGTLRLGLWCLAFTLIGMSSYVTTMIRAKAQPGINMYSVTNPYTLNGYLSREQYGDFPLLYGQTYEANQVGGEKTDAKYVLRKNESGKMQYIKAGNNYKPEYSKEDMMFLPRIWYGSEKNRKDFYSQWLNPKKEVTQTEILPDQSGQYSVRGGQSAYATYESENEAEFEAQKLNAAAQQTAQSAAKNGAPIYQYEVRDHLTQADNMNWLFSYQINWMYFRYFMWNFAGKQNDIQGFGNKRDGNWISGVNFIDNIRLGDQTAQPAAMQKNGSHNKLYFLPLILGMMGAFFHFKKHKDDALINLLLFLMTGLAIVGYLNQYGLQPRERDYAYVGSFYAFAVWIGLGTLQVSEWIGKIVKGNVKNYLAAATCFVAVPLLMANVEWNDHDRSKKTTAFDLARDYLNSCPQNAILFTIGDNDTYPLWFAQEVKGVRKDIRVVNTSLLGIDWYLDQLQYKVNESAPFKMIWKSTDYEGGKMDILYSDSKTDNTTLMPLSSLLENCIKTSDSERPMIAARKYYIDVDANKAGKMFNLTGTDTLATRIEAAIDEKKTYLTKGDLGILNIIAGNINERPICFTDDNGADVGALGIAAYLRRQGMVYQYIPSNTIKAKYYARGGVPSVELDNSYKAMMDDKLFGFGNAKTKGVYYDEENRRHLESIRSSYAAIAQEMVNVGRMDEAKALIKRIHTEMPSYSLPYGSPSRYDQLASSNLGLAQAAISAKETEIAAQILKEINADEMEQIKYFYALSNPGAAATQQDVEKFAADYNNYYSKAAGRMTQEEASTLRKVEESFKKNKLDAKTFQEMYFSYRNYLKAKELQNGLTGVPVSTPATAGKADTGVKK